MDAGLSPTGRVLRDYFLAKDENRPELLSRVFCAEAELETVVRTDAIAFPAHTRGRDAIAQVLVVGFAETYENVRSFYLSPPPRDAEPFSCAWLVGMSQRADGSTRVGCGRYDWTFEPFSPHRATRLVITIDAMQVLVPDRLASAPTWLQRLSCPWSSAAEVLAALPATADLDPIRRHLDGFAEARRAG